MDTYIIIECASEALLHSAITAECNSANPWNTSTCTCTADIGMVML